MGSSGLSCQQEVVSRLHQCLHLSACCGGFPGCSEKTFFYAVFKSCRRSARPFRTYPQGWKQTCQLPRGVQWWPVGWFCLLVTVGGLLHVQMCPGLDAVVDCLGRPSTMVWWFSKHVAFLYCSHRFQNCMIACFRLILPVLWFAQLDASFLRFARLCLRRKRHRFWIPWWEVGIIIHPLPGVVP